MRKLTAGLFSKVLKDSINEDLCKIVEDYAKYLEPATDTLINSEATIALLDIQKILHKKLFPKIPNYKKFKMFLIGTL